MRNRQNIGLIAVPTKLRIAESKHFYRQAQIINTDLVMVRAARQKNPFEQTHCCVFLHPRSV